MFACLCSCCSLAAQSASYAVKTDSLLSNYALRFPASHLHLHLDKSIYTANETIWFSSYLYAVAPDTFTHQLLFVKLVREDNDSLIRSAIFPILQKRAYGQLQLPTSVTPGNYKLLAYTDELRNGQPLVVFRQRLQIKTESQPLFQFRIEMVDSVAKRTDSFRVRLKATGTNGIALYNLPVQAEFYAGNKRILKQKMALDYKGEYDLMLPRSVNNQLSFKGQFDYEGTKEIIQFPVQQPIERPQVAFFPESGSLVAGTTTRMAIEVTGPGGQPLLCDVLLFADGKLITNTSTNVHGNASLFFPVGQKQYELKLQTNNGVFFYQLPTVQPKGVVIGANNGVVQDSIKLHIQNSYGKQDFRLMVHNFKAVFWGAEIRGLKQELNLAIPTELIPTGLYALTITNEALEPLAERLIFIQHDKNAVQITTDKTIYGSKEKISFRLEVNGNDGDSLPDLSVSVSAINRINFEAYADMLTGLFLRDDLTGTSGAALSFLRNQDDRLNDLLLTKGWRNYSWQFRKEPFVKVSPPTALHPGKGKVIAKNQGVYELALIGANGLYPYQTDSMGNYTLALEHLLVPLERPLFLAPVKEKSQKNFTILPDTTYVGIDLRAATIPLLEPPQSLPLISSNQQNVAASSGAKTMETVVIKTQKATNTFKSRTCKDWVCQYNILNCENHPFGGVPQDGETYLYRENRNAEAIPVVYIGCQSVTMLTPKEYVMLPRISIGKEFYKPVYDKTNESIPEYLTTLYWNPQVKMEKNVFVDSFFSSDSKGTFFCIAQGLINGRPVQASYTFDVK